ncbi:MAG: MazG nucleotide pyrophosphohydrolase domain-containing protein [Candidatus Moranbacteria bacterium]|nr:MazG nucleotide pyrophosphohydrolase domain-containing protein [Candidatus Moranbacteria bacterium]
MEFKEIEKAVSKTADDYIGKYDLKYDADTILFKLYEEIGELSEAYLTAKGKSRPEKFVSAEISKKKLSYELADVLGMTILLAKEMDIDLEDAINRKWIIKEWEK